MENISVLILQKEMLQLVGIIQ